jgi:glycosyltransferase involved in cell wall biosynthesis
VSTNVGGIPYLVDHGRDALLVPARDVVAMTGAVRRILVEPALAARLSENGRRRAERLDWSVVLPMWDAILCQAAGRASRGGALPADEMERGDVATSAPSSGVSGNV